MTPTLEDLERVIAETTEILDHLGLDHPDALGWRTRRADAVRESDRLHREQWPADLRRVVDRMLERR